MSFLLQSVAGMSFDEKDDKNMLDWEKVNAIEYVRKTKTAEQEKLDNRVIAIEDRFADTGSDICFQSSST